MRFMPLVCFKYFNNFKSTLADVIEEINSCSWNPLCWKQSPVQSLYQQRFNLVRRLHYNRWRHEAYTIQVKLWLSLPLPAVEQRNPTAAFAHLMKFGYHNGHLGPPKLQFWETAEQQKPHLSCLTTSLSYSADKWNVFLDFIHSQLKLFGAIL